MVPLGRIFRLGVELYTSRSRQDAYAVQTMHVTSVYYVCCRVGPCATDRWQSTFLAVKLLDVVYLVAQLPIVYIHVIVHGVKARQETYLLDELADSTDSIGCLRAAHVS